MHFKVVVLNDTIMCDLLRCGGFRNDAYLVILVFVHKNGHCKSLHSQYGDDFYDLEVCLLYKSYVV